MIEQVSDGSRELREAIVRRVIAALLVALSAPLAFAGGGADTDAGVPATLRIGTEGYYPPFNYIDESGELKGFDIDIALALCAQMEVECEFVAQDWDGIIPALLAKKYDAIVASMSITDERRRVVGFTDKYYSNQVRFVAAKGGGFDPGFLSGKNIGAQRAYLSLPRQQAEAAQALGLSRLRTLRHVLLPQVWRMALPGLGNLFLVLLKDTSLLSVVGLDELTRKSTIAVSYTKQPFTFYFAAALIYLAMTALSMAGTQALADRCP